jgi:hypothetical protein
MATNTIEVQGTLQADGTLLLDEKPKLPPGRVRVTMQLLGDVTQTDVWRVTQQIWAEQRARGHVSRSKDEIDASISAMREEDEERLAALEKLQQQAREARQRKACPES